MKFLAVALIAYFAVADGLSVKTRSGLKISSSTIDTLVKEGLFEYARRYLEANDPASLPDLGAQSLVYGELVNLTITITGAELSEASTFVVDDVSNDIDAMTGSFQVTFPTLKVAGTQTVSGTAMGEELSGTGAFSTELTNLVQSGDIVFTTSSDGSLQIDSLTLTYTVEGATFTVEGLSTASMTNDEIQTFMNAHLLTILEDNQTGVCATAAARVKLLANAFLTGKTLTDVITWLEGNVEA